MRHRMRPTRPVPKVVDKKKTVPKFSRSVVANSELEQGRKCGGTESTVENCRWHTENGAFTEFETVHTTNGA